MKVIGKIAIGASIPLAGAIVAPLAAILPNKKSSEVHILSFNDFHGAAVGYGDKDYVNKNTSGSQPGVVRMAKTINDIVTSHPGSLVLSAGDNNSGDAFSTSTHGKSLYPLLKAMDVTYSAVGNHAFEWGLDYMSKPETGFDSWARTDKTEGNYFVTANILNGGEYQGQDVDYTTWKEKRVKWADPYKVVDLNGHNIALIGLTTKLTKTDGNPTATDLLSFINYDASVNYTKRYMKEQMSEEDYDKIEAFVLLTHVSSNFDGGVLSDEAFDLARTGLTTSVDAIISGHSHKIGVGKVRNQNTGEYIWVGQAGTAGKAVLDTKFEFDDSKSVGHRLKSVSMSIASPYIDTAGIDVTSKTISAADKAKGKAAAEKQYADLIAYAQTLPDGNMFKNAVNEFINQRTFVNTSLNSSAGEYAKITHDLTYQAKNEAKIGHEYYSTKTVNELMGAWTNKASILGTELIKDSKAPKPAIAFINQDSITHEMKVDQPGGSYNVIKYDMYQLQTYENCITQGVLSVGQLANIIDYMLSGGIIGNGRDTNSAFVYGVDNKEYDLISDIEKDPLVPDSKIPLEEKKDAKGRTTKLRYLCGPLQFYGFRFEVEEVPIVYTKDFKCIRKYRLKWNQEHTLPKIWIYDPEDATNTNHKNIDLISDEKAWKPITSDDTGWKVTRYIPTVINSFVLGGGNYQATMFKPYFKYNSEQAEGDFNRVYTYPALFTRDALLKYCEAYNPNGDVSKGIAKCEYLFDLPEGIADKFVTYPQQ